MHARTAGRHDGFTLIELMAVVVIVGVLFAILLPAAADQRAAGRRAIDQANLQRLGRTIESYATDNRSRLFSFSITQATANLLAYADLQNLANTDSQVQSAAAQAVDIMRRRSGRGQSFDGTTYVSNWIPHVFYSHLVLLDYLAEALPGPGVVSPADALRGRWQADPLAFERGEIPGPAGHENRWPYGSSYETVPFVSFNDRCDGTTGGVTQATNHRSYYYANTSNMQLAAGRALSEVQFPCDKVAMFDSVSRYAGKSQVFYAYPDAVTCNLFFDGSVRWKRTGFPFNVGGKLLDANDGVDPANPNSTFPLLVTYSPDASWEPVRGGDTSRSAPGFQRWTRGGLKGRDFDCKQWWFPDGPASDY